MPLGSNRDYKSHERRVRARLAQHAALMEALMAEGMEREAASKEALRRLRDAKKQEGGGPVTPSQKLAQKNKRARAPPGGPGQGNQEPLPPRRLHSSPAGRRSETQGGGPVMAFPLGRITATPGALDALREADENLALLLEGPPALPAGMLLLGRHGRGDWGELDPEDKRENDRALRVGNRLLSAYTLATGVKVWIITEADRSSTCILLPDDY